MNMRTSKPGAGNKYYIRKANGGYNTCIQGSPTDSQCNVLANCVGYANGRFNEIIGSYKYGTLNCNAENFIERAIAAGLQVVSKPSLGGIMVWKKGATLSGSDGAGHVAVVERVDSANQIYTSESGYGSKAFWNSLRNNNNGKWGAGTGYSYRGCIVNPAIGYKPYEPAPTPTPTPTPSGKLSVGTAVTLHSGAPLYKSSDAGSPTGYAKAKDTVITRNNGSKHYYNTTGDYGWMDASGFTVKGNTPSVKTHTVRSGENLSGIAKKYGTTWQKIYNDNKSIIGSNPNMIKPGQVLTIN